MTQAHMTSPSNPQNSEFNLPSLTSCRTMAAMRGPNPTQPDQPYLYYPNKSLQVQKYWKVILAVDADWHYL